MVNTEMGKLLERMKDHRNHCGLDNFKVLSSAEIKTKRDGMNEIIEIVVKEIEKGEMVNTESGWHDEREKKECSHTFTNMCGNMICTSCGAIDE